ncbi:hypothetical protein Y032_0988g3301 [Ancylostoma ceylanicum]|uniref:GIY-YIG domain-containing protein n=3 Tax=Ancylostoma ceylanicum TaxID=53326 RepID=A0A016W838_9BILA|nr:hypothetical protein Y032_0019g3881 [Ancylostoma ceylanicum]EYC35761.1 hypothetical protein Y032_0988g3301 [Ancylostoma ceylanicum]
MLQYAAFHQVAVVCNESMAFLKRCRSHHIFPVFIENLLLNVPHQNNDGVRIGVARLKLALLNASIAAQKHRRGTCINGIIKTRTHLEQSLEPSVWKAFLDRNTAVCSVLRKRERDRLRRKLAKVLTTQSTSPSFINPRAVPPQRCTVLGSNMVDDDMKALLNLGPSFSVAIPAKEETYDSVLCGIHRFAHQLRWRIHQGPTVLDRIPTLLTSLPFPKSRICVPKPIPSLEPSIATLEVDIMRIYRNASKSLFASNLTSQELRGLRKLKAMRQNFRVTVGDKDGGFVIMPQDLDKALTISALADESIYETSSYRIFHLKHQVLETAVKHVLRKRWDTKTVARFCTKNPEVPTYYSLIKTHKLEQDVDLINIRMSNIKTRPIISSCGGPSDRISWLLVKLLSPLLHYVGAHIVNSQEFVSAIQKCRVPESSCYVSFDAVSLYTNIDNSSAVKSLLELLNNHSNEVSMWGFSTSDIEILLEATLACNTFRFNNIFYAQKRGLAMGIRIAPLLAIVFLDHIEKASLTKGILFYKRYIDDVFAIGSSRSTLISTLTELNSKDVNIKFTMEEPEKDGFLPFLNTRVRFCNGRSEIRWYRKQSSKNIMLHSRSAHPTYMKVNVVRNLKRTSERIAENDKESEEAIQRILSENGYNNGSTNTWRPFSAPDGIALVLPYLNECTSKQVNIVVKRSGLPVRLIFRPPPTLREILTSSRIYESGCDAEDCHYCSDQKICHLRGTVYMITCDKCGQRYIGETGRPLKERLDEHRRAFTSPQSYPNNSFSKHRTAVHTRESPPLFKITVLHRHLEQPLERKIMEAREIKRHNPEINSRDELAEALRLIA